MGILWYNLYVNFEKGEKNNMTITKNVAEVKTDISKKKLHNLISLFTILFLSGVIIVFSVLIFNFVSNMNSGSNAPTITYTGDSATEEPQVLTVGL